ncbi:TlpA family protein disulfide reductase [Pseudothauera nasutitermitis]|uniref:TlpA family protein disulfide reductase n=1 Tax=Pseudothauera nasutitermitis TaxID=2565930 RepID=A0A4S4AQA1_9RHOO|nr:TlpA disulfide reductase family protein [Pseudothauera nasutitermitis]THF61917.1 TlpA family protein disulfide reductase [Pseudothauera nasutitermitis]
MKRSTQFLLIGIVAAAAATAGYLTRGTPPAPAAAAQDIEIAQEAGGALLALTLPDLDGTPQALAQWQGKVLVLNFWATWCPPCRKEIPDFSAVSARMSGEPVQFVGLSIDSAEKVRAFQDEFQVPYPLLIGGNDTLQLTTALGNPSQGLPFTVLVGRDGRIAQIKLGTLKEDELERRIRTLL